MKNFLKKIEKVPGLEVLHQISEHYYPAEAEMLENFRNTEVVFVRVLDATAAWWLLNVDNIDSNEDDLVGKVVAVGKNNEGFFVRCMKKPEVPSFLKIRNVDIFSLNAVPKYADEGIVRTDVPCIFCKANSLRAVKKLLKMSACGISIYRSDIEFPLNIKKLIGVPLCLELVQTEGRDLFDICVLKDLSH